MAMGHGFVHVVQGMVGNYWSLRSEKSLKS